MEPRSIMLAVLGWHPDCITITLFYAFMYIIPKTFPLKQSKFVPG